jgi:hypothetical protein
VKLTAFVAKRHRAVHRLVLEAFVGPCPEGFEGCHFDGDPSNNAVKNLRWDTHLNNMKDIQRHGRHFTPFGLKKGEENHTTKIDAAAVHYIRASPQRRGVLAELARKYGISDTQVRRIRLREAWAHI